MSTTLTLFKRKGDRGADIFAGTFAEPGAHPGEWQALIRSRKLKDAGVKFLLIEFEDPEDLAQGYAEKVDRNLYIDLRFGNDVDGSSAYPRTSPLKTPQISKWVLDRIADSHKQRVVKVAVQPPVEVRTTPEPQPAEVQAEPVEDKMVDTTLSPPVDDFVSSWKLPVTVTLGGLFLLACGGAVGAAVWHSTERFRDNTPVLLVREEGEFCREIRDFENPNCLGPEKKFEEINWDLEVHPDGVPTGFLAAPAEAEM